MKYLGPTSNSRLNEAVAFVFLAVGLFLFISLVSYHPFDPSFNTSTSALRVENLTGLLGAYISDLMLQVFGLAAYAIPALIMLLGWAWIRSLSIDSPGVKILGGVMFTAATGAAFGLTTWHPIPGGIGAGGMAGSLVADALLASMNLTGALLCTAACWIVSVYLVSKFEVAMLASWLSGPAAWMKSLGRATARMFARFSDWRAERARMALLRRKAARLKPEVPLTGPKFPEPITMLPRSIPIQRLLRRPRKQSSTISRSERWSTPRSCRPPLHQRPHPFRSAGKSR